MLVDEKFSEWTAGLDRKGALISVFEHIRDIPYSLGIPMKDPDTAPEQILMFGKGNCGPKHYLLAEMYRRLGYEVAFATFPFLWNDPDLLYPPGLRQLSTGLPVAHHLACRVRINNRWILVDATWDTPLERGGFPVNTHWDGMNDTLCAVKSLESGVRTKFCRTATTEPYDNRREQDQNACDGEHDHDDAAAHARLKCEKTRMQLAYEIEQIHQFYREFETWLQEIRKLPQ